MNARLKEVNAQRLTEVDYDLSISGHTHGGQVRLPLLGAVYVEGKGLFPQEEDSAGLHSDGQGRYNYISTGLGASGFPGFRFCNPAFCFRYYAQEEVSLFCKRRNSV